MVPFQSYELAVREDRCGPRSRVAIPALLDNDGLQCPAVVTDLAIGGFAAEIAVQLPLDAMCLLRLSGNRPLQSRVVWISDGLVGCSFERLMKPSALETLLKRWRDLDIR